MKTPSHTDPNGFVQRYFAFSGPENQAMMVVGFQTCDATTWVVVKNMETKTEELVDYHVVAAIQQQWMNDNPTPENTLRLINQPNDQ
jgi:hypothetical protein